MNREELLQRRDELIKQINALHIELEPVLRQLERLGEETHYHGDGNRERPMWHHTHPFDDDDHEHHGTEEEKEAIARAREWMD